MREGNVFSLSTPEEGGGVPQPGPARSSQVQPGWYPSQVQPGQDGGTPAGGVPGYPHPQPGQNGGYLGYPLPPGLVRTGGVPQPGSTWGTPTPSQVRMGVPQPGGASWVPSWPGQDGGTWGTPPGQDSTWSTQYAAVGIPLAFMQEDFLVVIIICVGHSQINIGLYTKLKTKIFTHGLGYNQILI